MNLRAGFRALLVVACLCFSPSPVRAAAMLKQISNWTGGVANLPSDVAMFIYVPDNVVSNPPVLTIIHSCDNDAPGVFSQANGLKSAADQYGFIIVVPQSGNKRCWTTDSTQVWTRDKGGDSNAIKQMVVYALSAYKANPDRVYVTGCSSGGMMTELLLGLYPDIFKAGSSFAGMPAGCHGPNDNSSNATGYNGTCAGGAITQYTPQQWGDLVRAMDPGYTGHRPRLQLFHGSADTIISYANMAESVSQYVNLQNLSTAPTKTNTGLTLGTHQATEQQWNNACGYLVLDAFDSINGDHGPSDALFVPKYVVPFLGLDKTGPVDPEIQQCGDNGAGGASGMGGQGGHAMGGSAGSGAAGHAGTGGATGSGGSTGSGGTTGTGGSSGSGGTKGSGGATGSGGTGGSASGTGGSSPGTGGTESGSGGHPGATGGSTGSGGSTSGSGGHSGGSGGSTGSGSGNDSGGGCTVARADVSAGFPLSFIALGLVGLIAVRARRRR
jgi:poly(hydroxyalkanoate) depolymerase family esterase